jgi:uncharacterized membrane protein YhaH (DUF805 family)
MHWYLEVMRKYAVFSGRARRQEYWMFQLINTVIFAVLITGLITELRSPTVGIFVILFCGYILATIIPGLAVSVRRLHDADFSGLWLLVSLVPGGGILLLVFYVMDGTPGPNRYGPNPKATGMADYVSYGTPPMTPYGTQSMTRAAGAGAALPGSQPILGFCRVCGTSMLAGTRFCSNCGKAAY